MAKRITLESIKALFPIKVRITKEMINSAKLYNVRYCIGAKALKKALPNIAKHKDFDIKWGVYSGRILNTKDNYDISIATNIDMMEIKQPKTVTFKLR